MPGCLINDDFINYCSCTVYNTAPKTYVHLRTYGEKLDNEVCCFYDTYPIKGNVVGLPKKLNQNGSFTIWGCFCSLECARAYVLENNTCNQSKESSLLALYGIKTYGINFRLQRAADKLLLEKFGGPLSIEEWRKECHSTRLWVLKLPQCERTSMAYECYLNHDSTDMKVPAEAQVQNKNVKEKKKTTLELDKRKTPAHYTKKSLLSFFNNRA